jgi:hypothetical protein
VRSLAALALIAAATLGGCALPTERPRMTWELIEHPDKGAKLVLGVPDTDDVRLMMTCRPRGGAVTLTLIGRRGDPAVAELHSGEVWNRYAGAGIADDETDGAMNIEFELQADDPVLVRLADTGQLVIVLSDRRLTLPNAFAPAHDFLAICRQ